MLQCFGGQRSPALWIDAASGRPPSPHTPRRDFWGSSLPGSARGVLALSPPVKQEVHFHRVLRRPLLLLGTPIRSLSPRLVGLEGWSGEGLSFAWGSLLSAGDELGSAAGVCDSDRLELPVACEKCFLVALRSVQCPQHRHHVQRARSRQPSPVWKPSPLAPPQDPPPGSSRKIQGSCGAKCPLGTSCVRRKVLRVCCSCKGQG